MMHRRILRQKIEHTIRKGQDHIELAGRVLRGIKPKDERKMKTYDQIMQEAADDPNEAEDIKEQMEAATRQEKTPIFRPVFHEMFTNPTGEGMLNVVSGKGERGKSHLGKAIISSIMLSPNPYSWVIAFVPDRNFHGFDFIDQSKVFENYDEAVLRQLDKQLQDLHAVVGHTMFPKGAIIFDDQQGLLQTEGGWFANFIARIRHYKVDIFIFVQYLAGRKSISPLMKEQTSNAVMFNSKTHQTLKHLYEAYGGHWESFDAFKEYFTTNTNTDVVGKYVAMVYQERVDRMEDNYTFIRAPEVLPKFKISLY